MYVFDTDRKIIFSCNWENSELDEESFKTETIFIDFRWRIKNQYQKMTYPCFRLQDFR